MSSFRSLAWIPLTDPAVPTGMKMGVSISPCAVLILPARAFVPEQLDTSSNNILVFKNGIKDNYSGGIDRCLPVDASELSGQGYGFKMTEVAFDGNNTDNQALYCLYQF